MIIHAKQRHEYTIATLPDGTSTFYHRGNFPVKLGGERDGGNWEYWHDPSGYVASIPTPEAEAGGCKPSHFGDLAYWSKFAADRCNLTRAGRLALRLVQTGGRRECAYCYQLFRPDPVDAEVCRGCSDEKARNVDRARELTQYQQEQMS